jgi:large conductance mechanosensitive channel
MLKEFKEFAMKGNLIDMAVGVVMGGAFGKVTTAFIDGMVMPLIGMLSGGIDLTKAATHLQPEIKDAAGAVTQAAVDVKWGQFLTDVINFLVVAGVVFMIIKSINAAKKAEPAPAPPPPPVGDTLLGEIRDLLKSGR